MALFRWSRCYDPFADMEREMERFQQQVHSFFRRERRSRPQPRESSFPLINLLEDRDNFYIHGELPGVYPQDLNIVIHGEVLTIEGQRWAPHAHATGRYHRQERETGRFRRTIQLPAAVDRDRVSAELENGILNMVLPKVHKSAPVQKIRVRRQ